MANDSFGVLHVCKLEGKSVSSTFVETAKFSWHILVTKIFCIPLKIAFPTYFSDSGFLVPLFMTIVGKFVEEGVVLLLLFKSSSDDGEAGE